MMRTIFFQVICHFTDASWRIFSLTDHREASRVFFISKNLSSTFIECGSSSWKYLFCSCE